MNVYDAIMRAADHIEQNPSLFYFHSVRIPECGTPGCALGWIGHFMGLEAGSGITHATNKLGLDRDDEFYGRMRMVTGGKPWRETPQELAVNLRLYAAKYHAPTEAVSDRFPAWLADLKAKIAQSISESVAE